MQKTIAYIVLFIFLLSSCVTPKIHNAIVAENEARKSKLKSFEKKELKLNSELEELQGEVNTLKFSIRNLRKDSVQNGEALTALQNTYKSLVESYDLLVSKSSRELAKKAKESKQLLENLEEAQSDLFNKEDEVNTLLRSLELKEKELLSLEEKLVARSNRVAELELIINRKDSVVTALKSSISKALIGLEGAGLTIEQRNGKVYISLEEDLLFASGKYEVNSRGVSALNKLADVLANEKDLAILVEGHTDSIPFGGRGFIKDNWDLSVMRATNVVKVLTQNSNLDPVQLTAAGRSEFVPIASNASKEGRRSNRRIEMILSPNLDDLFKLLAD